ncbi:MAG: hypothetical protein ACRC2T_12300, partial [Thermoguttaceae bacterium]
ALRRRVGGITKTNQIIISAFLQIMTENKLPPELVELEAELKSFKPRTVRRQFDTPDKKPSWYDASKIKKLVYNKKIIFAVTGTAAVLLLIVALREMQTADVSNVDIDITAPSHIITVNTKDDVKKFRPDENNKELKEMFVTQKQHLASLMKELRLDKPQSNPAPKHEDWPVVETAVSTDSPVMTEAIIKAIKQRQEIIML